MNYYILADTLTAAQKATKPYKNYFKNIPIKYAATVNQTFIFTVRIMCKQLETSASAGLQDANPTIRP